MREELGGRGRTVGTLADGARASLGRQLRPPELERLVEEGGRLRLEAALELALGALG
jgi:hypothetical protein